MAVHCQEGDTKGEGGVAVFAVCVTCASCLPVVRCGAVRCSLQAAKVLAVGRHMAISSARKVGPWVGGSLRRWITGWEGP